MFEPLNPRGSPGAAAALADLTRLVPALEAQDRARWAARIAHLYGSLSGQRGLGLDALVAEQPALVGAASLEDAIVALHSYFAFVAQLVACAFAAGDPLARLRAWAHTPRDALADLLTRIASGAELEAQGYLGAAGASPLGGFVAALDEPAVAAWARFMAELRIFTPDALAHIAAHPDPLGAFYAELIPRNILHALGEFYTPGWLAELILAELAPEDDASVLDPFCGSGAFVLAALRWRLRRGLPLSEALGGVLGIDLNPVACASCQANLVIALAALSPRGPHDALHLPVLCADALGPALELALAAAGHAPLAPDDDGAPPDLVHIDPRWLPTGPRRPRYLHPTDARACPAQAAVMGLKASDVLVTNPPWVGWEYQSRSYRDHVQPVWDYYELSPIKGQHRAFLKEDLSTLALVAAWDTLLREGGRSAAVLRTSTMTSSVASSGLRRLSRHPREGTLALEHVHVLDDLQIFPRVSAPASVWRVRRDAQTAFPVPCAVWQRTRARWQPTPVMPLHTVLQHVEQGEAAVAPVDLGAPWDRWVIGERRCIEASASLGGTCAYRARAGVFTGGANAVYHLERLRPLGQGCSEYANVVGRSRRAAPQVQAPLEDDLVFELIRGRDVQRWRISGAGLLLCPHTAETRMEALDVAVMARRFPRALEYLNAMRGILDARGGFTTWEQGFRDRAFYAIQRIGEYTFAPWKVCWRYIATDFICAVLGPDDAGRPRLPNDKVVSIAVDSADEAYYLCGLLTSSPLRWQVTAHSCERQLSASTLDKLCIPIFDPAYEAYQEIAACCHEGHTRRLSDPGADLAALVARIDRVVAGLYGIEAESMARFERELRRQGLTL